MARLALGRSRRVLESQLRQGHTDGGGKEINNRTSNATTTGFTLKEVVGVRPPATRKYTYDKEKT